MSKNTIKIDGAKLKRLLEERSGVTVYQISESEGFSRNFLAQACRSGKASPIVQSVANKYSVRQEEYILKDDLKQMSIEDLQVENTTKVIETSRKAFRDLAEAVNKAGEELRSAFIRLTKEWNKAIEEYNKSIEKIKEGK